MNDILSIWTLFITVHPKWEQCLLPVDTRLEQIWWSSSWTKETLFGCEWMPDERYYTYSVPLTTFSGFFLWIRIMYLDWFYFINVFTGIHVFYDLSTIKRLNSIFCSHVFLCAILVQRRHAWSKNKCWTTFSSHILLPFTPFSWIFMVSFRFPHFGNIHTLGL